MSRRNRMMSMLLACGLVFGTVLQADATDREPLTFDGEDFELALVDLKEGIVTNAYVRKGETLDNWTKLVQVRHVPDIEKPFEAAAEYLILLSTGSEGHVIHTNNHFGSVDIIMSFLRYDRDGEHLVFNIYKFCKESESGGIKIYQFSVSSLGLPSKDFVAQVQVNRNRWLKKIADMTLEITREPVHEEIYDLWEEGYPHYTSFFLLQIAIMVYEPKDAILKWLESKHYQHIQFFEKGDTQAVGFVHRGHAFLVFRGTSSIGDLITNLRVRMTGTPKRHRGFDQAWKLVAEDVRSWLKQIPEGYRRIILSGHSLGGALAILAAFELCEMPTVKIRAVIPFETPKIGGIEFKHAYEAKPISSSPDKSQENLYGVTWREVNGSDFVAHLLPPIMDYWHVGRQRWLFNGEEYFLNR